jgi:hypothetical protein
MITTVEVRFARRDMVKLAKDRMRDQGVDVAGLSDEFAGVQYDEDTAGYLVSFELGEVESE